MFYFPSRASASRFVCTDPLQKLNTKAIFANVFAYPFTVKERGSEQFIVTTSLKRTFYQYVDIHNNVIKCNLFLVLPSSIEFCPSFSTL